MFYISSFEIEEDEKNLFQLNFNLNPSTDLKNLTLVIFFISSILVYSVSDFFPPRFDLFIPSARQLIIVVWVVDFEIIRGIIKFLLLLVRIMIIFSVSLVNHDDDDDDDDVVY